MFLTMNLMQTPNTKPTPGIITSNIHLLITMSELNIYTLNIRVPS